MLALVIGLPISIHNGGFLAFAYIGALSGLALIILFISVSVAVIVSFRRKFKEDFHPLLHIVLPILGIGTFAIPLVGTFYPVPAAPYSYLPYITVGWLVLGILVAIWLGVKRPDALNRIERVFLTDGPDEREPRPSATPAEPHTGAVTPVS